MQTRKSKAYQTVEGLCPIFRKAPRFFIKLLLTVASRQRGRVVRVPGLKSGDPEFKSRSDHQLDLFHLLNSSAALVYSQLVCLLPVGILNLLSLFQKVECLWTSLRAECISTINKEFGFGFCVWNMIWCRCYENLTDFCPWDVGWNLKGTQ